MKICIAISTYGDRVNAIRLPEEQSGVHYLIVHQKPVDSNWPEKYRPDVVYLPTGSLGISKSRNVALEHAEADFLHFMDDDTTIIPQNIIRLCELMAVDNIHIGTGQFAYSDGSSKKYKVNSFKHNKYSTAKVSSIEICVKLPEVRAVKFDEQFGLGTELPSGEEYIYLIDLLEAGFKAKFYPVTTSCHPPVTSGQDFYSTSSRIRAKRLMIERAFPTFSFIFKLAFFLKKVVVLFKKRKLTMFLKNFFL